MRTLSFTTGARIAPVFNKIKPAARPVTPPAPKAIAIGAEVNAIKQQLKQLAIYADLQKLMGPKTMVSLWWIIKSFMLIAAATWVFVAYPLALPVSLLLFTRSLRALGNQVHDLAHFNVFKSARFNKWVGTYVLGPLLFYHFERYVNNHSGHHGDLGTDGKDEDIIVCPGTIKAWDSDLAAFAKIYTPLLFSKAQWLSSVFGHLIKATWKERSIIAGFWALLLGTIGLIFGFSIALTFAALWLLTRATTYHALKMFVELADHACLQPVTVIGYTRTMPDNWLTVLINPENDNWHTAHHLFPKVPMPNLKKAHQILMKVPAFKNGQHVTSYFRGPRSLLKSLIRR